MAFRGLSTFRNNGGGIVSSIFNTRHDTQSIGITFSRDGIDVIGLTESNGKTIIDRFFQLDTDDGNPLGRETARKLRTACVENGINIRKVSNTVSENECSLKYVDLPEMPVDEIIDSLRFSERDSFPFPLENGAIDVSVIEIGSKPGRLKILMAIIDSESIDSYRNFFKYTNLKHSAITTIPSALTALINKSISLDGEKSVAFLTFDNSTTGLYIFRDGEPEFIRHIQFGMRHVAYPQPDDLSKQSGELKIETEENRITDLPNKYKNPDRSDFWGYVKEHGQAEPNFERLVFELKRSLEYYQNEFNTDIIEKLLCVSASPRIKSDNISSLSKVLSERLNIPVEPYNPFEDFLTVEEKSLGHLQALGSSLAIPVGIAINRDDRLNLLPLRDRYSLLRKTTRRLPQVAVAAYILFVITFALIGRWHVDDLNRQITNIEKGLPGNSNKSTSIAKEIQSDIDSYKMKISEIDSRLSKYPPLMGNDISWVNMFHVLSSTIPADISLDSVGIRFSSNTFTKSETGNQLELEGSVKGSPSRQLLTLREFINGLKLSDHFTAPSLASSNIVPANSAGSKILKFRITATAKRL